MPIPGWSIATMDLSRCEYSSEHRLGLRTHLVFTKTHLVFRYPCRITTRRWGTTVLRKVVTTGSTTS